MIRIDKKLRCEYKGEDIVVERKFKNGSWQTVTEYVPNQLNWQQMSNRAVVIGNGVNRLGLNVQLLNRFIDPFDQVTFQTYGCNALYRDFNPDFLIALGSNEIISEIANSRYANKNITYSSAANLIEFPEKFYLIPHNPYADAGTTAAYIAAFDGHKQIYLFGFDGHEEGWNNNVYAGTNGYDPKDFDIDHTEWILNRKQLFDVYDDVDWVWVTPVGKNLLPDILKYCFNLRQIDFKQFVIECDL